VLTGASEPLTEELASGGVAVHCLGVSSHYDLRWLPRLRALLIGEGIDLVHLHLPYTAALGRLVVGSIPRSARPHVVYTEHNVWQRTTPVVPAMHRATYRLDDADVAVSSAVWTALPRPLRFRTEVLVHGLPVEDLDDVPLTRREVRHRRAAVLAPSSGGRRSSSPGMKPIDLCDIPSARGNGWSIPNSRSTRATSSLGYSQPATGEPQR
jgi:hypothetical protein